MGEIKRADNFRDMCEENGARAGFQFEFYCERCNDTWESEFKPFAAGQAAEWGGRISSMLGGLGGGLVDAVSGAGEATFGSGREKALEEAITAADEHFNRCAKCTNMVCDACWNAEAGLCFGCAPNAEVEIEAAVAAGRAQAAGEKAALHGIHEGKHMDVKERKQLVCPSCSAETKGAKFCPECGEKLAAKSFCTECGAEMGDAAKFCPECGTPRPAAPAE